MVIQCSSCQTRFRLADDKIKPEGTKVRCSRCGEVFTVFPAESPAVAAEPPAAPPPEPPAAAEPKADFEDWSDFEPPAREASSALTDEGRQESAPSFDFAFEEDSAASQEPTADGEETEREEAFDEFSLEETSGETVDYDALSFEEEDVPSTGGEEKTLDELSFETELPGGPGSADASFDSDLGSGVADEFSFEESEESPLPDLDAFGDNDTFGWEEGSAPLEDSSQEFEFGAVEAAEEDSEDLDFSGATLSSERPEATKEPTPAPPPPKPSAPAAAPPPPPAAPAAKPEPVATLRKNVRKKRPRRRHGLTSFLILLLLGLCAGAGYLYWSGRLPEVGRLLDRLAGSRTAPVVASQIRISDLNSYFVTNPAAGQLFVIDGRAVNGYPEPRSALAVRGILFDRSGKVLRERLVYCGNPLSEKELKTLPWAKIRERVENQFGDSLSNLNLASGKSLPFTIVFNELPQNLAEFSVEPADSLPGSK